MHPLQTANYLLILLGIGLIISGPVITYKTVQGALQKRKEDPTHHFTGGWWINSSLNLLIAVLFFIAGILFVINNLRGNPLA